IVTGPADKIAQARAIMKEVDVPQPGQQERAPGPPMLKTYAVPGGNAEALGRVLQEMYRTSTTVRISAAGNSSLLVLAPAQDQMDIARHIIGQAEKGLKTEVIPLTMDATKVVDTLNKIYGEPKTGAPYLEADTTRNAVIVRGTAEQVADVRQTIKDIGDG